MMHMTAVINNLCYKAKENKKVLGEDGYVKNVCSAYRRWSGDDFNQATTIQALKATGNLTGNPNNAAHAVKHKFVKAARESIEKHIDNEPVILTTVAVLGNVAGGDSIKKKEEMIKQGFAEGVNTAIKAYESNPKTAILEKCYQTLEKIVKSKKLAN